MEHPAPAYEIEAADEPKRKPVRTRHAPVGDIPTDLVDRVLKVIKTKDLAAFKAEFARRLNWSSVEAMERAHRRAMRFARVGVAAGRRIPSHVADKIAQVDLLSQVLVRRFG